MKKVVLAAIAVGMIFMSCKEDATKKIRSENIEVAANRDEVSKKLPVMTFEKTEHNFGTIKQGTPVETVFKFTNTGDAPLIITNTKSSCGCTVPQYPKDKPIAPGETGELLVKFNGSGKNSIIKTVTVTANTAKRSEKIKIRAFVEASDNAAAPSKKATK